MLVDIKSCDVAKTCKFLLCTNNEWPHDCHFGLYLCVSLAYVCTNVGGLETLRGQFQG